MKIHRKDFDYFSTKKRREQIRASSDPEWSRQQTENFDEIYANERAAGRQRKNGKRSRN
jgi:hypothetical protein